MRVKAYFRKVIEGEIEIEVPSDASYSEIEDIVEDEYTEDDCYLNENFEVTDYDILEE